MLSVALHHNCRRRRLLTFLNPNAFPGGTPLSLTSGVPSLLTTLAFFSDDNSLFLLFDFGAWLWSWNFAERLESEPERQRVRMSEVLMLLQRTSPTLINTLPLGMVTVEVVRVDAVGWGGVGWGERSGAKRDTVSRLLSE